jgi:hypothetical protein
VEGGSYVKFSFKAKITQILLLWTFVTLLIFHIPTPVSACSCAPPPSVEAALTKSDAVFSGKVISVKDKLTISGYRVKTVIFEVSKTWKGERHTQIMVTTGQGGGDCGIHFSEGEDYLVYARISDMYANDQLTTILCDRTDILSSAKNDLSILGEGKLPVKQVDILKSNFNHIVWLGITIIFGGGMIGYLSWRKFKK